VANVQNLIPNSERTPEELHEMAVAGGIASGAARRRKKSLREAADLYLSLPVRDKRKLNAMLRDGIAEEDADNQMAVIVGLTKMAMLGESKAAKVLFELLEDGSVNAGQEAEDDPLTKALMEEAERMQNETD
jgi:hypothetical protein